MDPITTAVTMALVQGLVQVGGKLLDAGTDATLEPAKERLKKWIQRDYREAEKDKKLRKVVQEAIKQAGDLGDDENKWQAWFKQNGLYRLQAENQQNLRRQLARAVLDFTDPSTAPPEDIRIALGWPQERAGELSKLLVNLRAAFASLDDWKAPIEYADAAIEREQAERMAKGIEALVEHFGIPANEDEALREYLEALRDQLLFLPLPLADPGAASKADAELRKIFVPLTMRDLRVENESRRLIRNQESHRADLELAIKDEKTHSVGLGDILARHKCFVLIGGAGSGKTTLLKMIALAFVEDRAAEDLGWTTEPLFPIFLRLRNFGAFLAENPNFSEPGPGALTAYLTHHFCQSYALNLKPKFFDRQLKTGKCLILLDGLDEVSQGRADVALQVSAFIQYYGRKGNHFGLASRPRGFESVEEYLWSVDMAVCDVNPLDPSGIRQLIGNLLEWIVNDSRQLAKDKKDLAEKILLSTSLTELASTPLFCTALTLVYKYHGSDLPQRRVDVLEQVVDLLLGFWKAQEPGLAKKPELAIFDGIGEIAIDLDMAVVNKRSRLSYLAYKMQIANQKTEVDADTAQGWLQEYFEAVEGQERETAKKWAQGFLRYAHEHSGLFVEQEGPGVYVFTHEGFREYLAARELIDLGEQVCVNTILEYIHADLWEQVILLAAAWRGNSRRMREDLIQYAVEKTQSLRAANDENWLRCLTMAGHIARDMDKHLPAPKRRLVEDLLHATMIDGDALPKVRSTAADSLDELGYLPLDLYSFAEISTPQAAFRIGKYPVTNIQYKRFLEADDFAKKAYWDDFPKFSEPDENTREVKEIGDWGEAGWQWLQKKWDENKNLFPRYWQDARFGIVRPGVPVVGISWYETNAYCRWLLAHWDELDEAEQNPGWKPTLLRLPTEAEWIMAAGGANPEERFPWDKTGEVTQKEPEILRCANVAASGIGRTTPVGLYPLGASPQEVWDLGGNVWEWQANYYSTSHESLALRGGSWGFDLDSARLSNRVSYYPGDRWDYFGFRVAALRSAAQ